MANFRVVIAGGGITGLTLANALQHANIDYVLLEGRDDIGSHWAGGVGVSLCAHEHPHLYIPQELCHFAPCSRTTL